MPDLVERRPLAGVDYPRTLVEFNAFFRDEAACRQFLGRSADTSPAFDVERPQSVGDG